MSTLSVDSMENVPLGLLVLVVARIECLNKNSSFKCNSSIRLARRTSTEQTGLAQICCIRVAGTEISRVSHITRISHPISLWRGEYTASLWNDIATMPYFMSRKCLMTIQIYSLNRSTSYVRWLMRILYCFYS